MNKRALKHFLLGAKEELPILVGVAPLGMIYGVLALSAGLSSLQAQSMSSIIFAGSAQFMIAQLVRAGTPVFVIVLTGLVINLRHALYSVSLAPHLKHLPISWKAILAYLLTDEVFAVTVIHYQREEAEPFGHWYFFGAGLALWLIWQLSTAIGIFLGTQIPASWGLDFSLPLTFIALVVPSLKDRAGIVSAIVACLAAVLFFSLPYKLGLIAAAFVAISFGLLVEVRS